MKTLFAGIFVSFALLSPTIVHAQTPTDADVQKAKDLFAQAQEAYNAEDYNKALSYYTAAYALAKKPTILFNIGQCHRKLNHPKEASDNYKQFIKDEPETQYRGEVEYKIAELEEQLGNKKEALNYYQLYLQHRLTTDTNEATAKIRIAALEKEIGPITVVDPTSKPIDKITDPSTDGKLSRFIKQPTTWAAIGASAVAAPLWITARNRLGTPDFGKGAQVEVKPACLEDENPICNDPENKKVKAAQVMALSGDILFLGALGLLGVSIAKSVKSPEATTQTTSLRLVPTTTGGFVTFSFTPKP